MGSKPDMQDDGHPVVKVHTHQGKASAVERPRSATPGIRACTGRHRCRDKSLTLGCTPAEPLSGPHTAARCSRRSNVDVIESLEADVPATWGSEVPTHAQPTTSSQNMVNPVVSGVAAYLGKQGYIYFII